MEEKNINVRFVETIKIKVMIIWNFETPFTILGSCIWNAAEYLNISLGRLAPTIFGMALGTKKKRIK